MKKECFRGSLKKGEETTSVVDSNTDQAQKEGSTSTSFRKENLDRIAVGEGKGGGGWGMERLKAKGANPNSESRSIVCFLICTLRGKPVLGTTQAFTILRD